MKTIEEKAKAYDEALEKAKKLYEEGTITESIGYIFPELTMSEDEKIRNSIIENLKGNMYRADGDYDLLNKQIAWLEKQESVEEIVERCKDSWYNEGKIAGMAEGLSDDEKYQQGWHDALEAWKDMRLEVYAQASGNKHEPNDSDDTTKMFSLNDIDEIFEKITETCEEKPADKVEPKFKVGEWVVDNEEGDFLKVIKVRDNTYRLVSQEGEEFDIQQSVVEYDYHRFTINDAKDADVLYSLDSKQPFIFKHRKPNEQAKVYCGINIYGKFFVGNTKDCIITTDKYIPATKDQRDTLLKAMADAGYGWDADKKELKKIEQEPENYKRQVMSEMADLVIDYIKKKPSEWDEDDERLRKTSISFLKHYADKGYENAVECIDWLESIKDRVHSQSHWKPSEEQMDALEHFVRGIGESGHASPYDANLKLVHSLLNDLRKLNEE